MERCEHFSFYKYTDGVKRISRTALSSIFMKLMLYTIFFLVQSLAKQCITSVVVCLKPLDTKIIFEVYIKQLLI